MALVVGEDSYLSVAEADAYHAAMGNAAWAEADESTKEVALRRATAYIDARYRFRGEPVDPLQPLAWPRRGFPWPLKRIMDATAELALRALTGPLYQDVQPEGAVRREVIGPLSTEYFDPQNGGQVRYALIDDLLAPLVIAAGGVRMVRLERA